MNKTLKIIGIILLLGLFVWGYISVADFSPKSGNAELIEKLNTLERKLDSLQNKKDSIRVVVDSTHVKIITNEKHYQERINTIIVQSSSADSQFVTNYINARLDSIKAASSDTSGTRKAKR